MNLVIAFVVVITSVAAGLVMWHLRRLLSDQSDLESRCERLPDLHNAFPELSSSPKPGEPLAAKAARALQAQMTAVPPRVSEPEVADAIAAELDDRVLGPRRVNSIVVFVALVGTLWGLSLAVGELSGLKDLKSADDLGEFLTRSRSLLAGFGSAFYATIVGVVATVVLTSVDYVYARYTSRYLARCEELLSASIRPALERHLQIVTPESFVRKAGDVLEAMARDMPEAARELIHVVRQATVTAVRLREMTESASQATQTLENSIHGLSSLPDRLDDHLSRLGRTHSDLVEAQAEWMRSSSASADKSAERIRDAVGLMSQANESLTQFRRDTRQYADQAQNLASSLTQSLAFAQRIETSANSIGVSVQSAARSMDETLVGLNAAAEAVRLAAGEVAAASQAVREAKLSQLSNQQTEALLREMLATLKAIQSQQSAGLVPPAVTMGVARESVS